MKTLLIQKNTIKANLAKIRQRSDNSLIYAVLKDNAYGLGLLEMATILREEGILRFALTEIEDAVMLRTNGFDSEEILMLRSTSEAAYIEALDEYNLVGTIGSQNVALAVSGIAEKRKTVIEAHVKIDCGMGRFGFLPSEFEKIVSTYNYSSGVALTGIYTHFPRAYDNEIATRKQCDQFADIVEKLRAKGIEPGLVHAANSAALFRYDFCNFDAVRIGSAITGRISTRTNYSLQKAGYVTATVDEVRWLPKGSTIGYGSSYKTSSPRRIAVIPVGYSDGFCVEKSKDTYKPSFALRYILSVIRRCITRKRLFVTINDARAPVVGHVGMLHTTVDVTNITCEPGDTAVFDINPLFLGGISRTFV